MIWCSRQNSRVQIACGGLPVGHQMRSRGSSDGTGILELSPESLWWLRKKGKGICCPRSKRKCFQEEGIANGAKLCQQAKYWPLDLASRRLLENVSGFVREVGAKAQVGVRLYILKKVAFSMLFSKQVRHCQALIQQR